MFFLMESALNRQPIRRSISRKVLTRFMGNLWFSELTSRRQNWSHVELRTEAQNPDYKDEFILRVPQPWARRFDSRFGNQSADRTALQKRKRRSPTRRRVGLEIQKLTIKDKPEPEERTTLEIQKRIGRQIGSQDDLNSEGSYSQRS